MARKRTERLSIYLTVEEMADLEKVAAISERERPDYARRVLMYSVNRTLQELDASRLPTA